MGRGPRIDVGDIPYHVINRANGRSRIFFEDADYVNFEYLLDEIRETYAMRILAYHLMPNHWHLVLYPRKDGDLAKSLQWLGTTHARRFRTRTNTVGYGHLYQDRYKCFAIQKDAHLLAVLKYVERNSVRAGLAELAESWRWGSAYRRLKGTPQERSLLSELPIDLPEDYRDWINAKESAEDLKNIRKSVDKSCAYGGSSSPN